MGNSKHKGRGRSLGSSGNGTGGSTGGVAIVPDSRFTVLDYELSLPIKYEHKKWSYFITPTYAMLVNPLSYSTGQGTETESLSNSFFVEIGASFSFKH